MEWVQHHQQLLHLVAETAVLAEVHDVVHHRLHAGHVLHVSIHLENHEEAAGRTKTLANEENGWNHRNQTNSSHPQQHLLKKMKHRNLSLIVHLHRLQ